MFIRWNGSAKGHVSQVLQGIRESVVLRVSGLPQSVSLCESLRRKGGQPQQVVRPILDHVDSQVVPSVDTKVWPVCLTQGKSFKFQKSVQRRVLHSLDFRNVHQAPDCLRVVDLPAGSKHRPQFERQHVWIVSAYVLIGLSNFRGSLAVQARCLKQDGYAVETDDGVDLPAIKHYDVVAGVLFDVGARHKRTTLPERLRRTV